MALRLVFNVLSGKFDYIDKVDTSAFASAVPITIADGATYTIADNTQVTYSDPIVIAGNGSILLQGDSSITWVD